MQRLEVGCAVRITYTSLGAKGLSEVRELTAELICTDFARWRLLPTPHCQVHVPKVDFPVLYCPSLILSDAIWMPTITEHCG